MSRPTMTSPVILEAGLLPLWKVLRVDEYDDVLRARVIRMFREQGPILDEEVIVERLVNMVHGWGQEDVEEAVEEAACALVRLTHRHVKAWVHNVGLVPRLAMGDKLTVTRQGRSRVGTVVAIHPDVGTYTVNVPEEGHVTAGELGTHGWVIPFEQAHQDLPGGGVPRPEDFVLVSPAVV